MKGFTQNTSGYTADSMQIVFPPASTNYDPAVLDNPVRKKVNFAVVQANIRQYKRASGAL